MLKAPVPTVHRGHLIHLTGSPTVETAVDALVDIEEGAIAVDGDGRIVYSGAHDQLPDAYAGWAVHDVRPGYLLPGFVDTHVHYPQVFSTDAYGGGQLLQWLETAVFPAEARFADAGFAALAAGAFCDRRIASGTTAALVFGSSFPAAQDALWTETHRRGLRMVSGRGIQTRGPASAGALITSEADAIAMTRAEVERWHTADTGDPRTSLLQVALMPRFGLSVTPETLQALGELYGAERERGLYFHTHISENATPGSGEIDQTLSTYQVQQYLDVYDGKFLEGSAVGGESLLGRRSVLAHAVHSSVPELERMAETGTSIAHCPTSNLFLGSGTMPWQRVVDAGVGLSVGTDIGAGDEWMISRVLNDAYKVHMSESPSVALEPEQLLFLGTLGGARALDMEERFGNFDAGKDADFIVIDPAQWDALDDTLGYGVRDYTAGLDRRQFLFTLLGALREPAITEVYVAGRKVS